MKVYFHQVLLLAALPVIGNYAGSLLAELVPVSDRVLSLALHAAAGVILAVVGVELLPQALEVGPAWIMALALILGSVFYLGIDAWSHWLEKKTGRNSSQASMAIYLAVAVDLFSDGVMIGAGSTIALNLGLLLASAQVIADVPEGFAAIATFRNAGFARSRRFLAAATLAVPAFLGAGLGYWGLKDEPLAYRMAVLAFTSGILLSVVTEEMILEAHRVVDPRLGALFLVGGFSSFALISAWVGK